MRAFPALAGALLLVAAAPSGLSPRRYDVPGQKALRLDMPADWREEIKRPRPDLPPTIRITTDEGADHAAALRMLRSARQ